MRILVVEDERRMAELLRQGLMEDGHAVTVAVDGRDGLAFAEPGGFDLVILDRMLPGMSGLEIARQLRAHRDRTPILLPWIPSLDDTAHLIDPRHQHRSTRVEHYDGMRVC